MQIVLVGADLEENLGLGLIAAVAEQAGHRVQIVPFNEAGQGEEIAARIRAHQPEIVGLSLQFQHRRVGVAASPGSRRVGVSEPELSDFLSKQHTVPSINLDELDMPPGPGAVTRRSTPGRTGRLG